MAKATPLLELHREAGARVVEFAGFQMPLQYSGVVDEHHTVRKAVGLFDVSHMGQVFVEGEGAAAAADRLVTNRVDKLSDGDVLYTPICRPDGGIVDDCLVYRFNDQKILFVVNASNVEKDFRWIAENCDSVKVENRSDQYALLALQGPKAFATLGELQPEVLQMTSFTFRSCSIEGVEALVSTTGYTGEDGFEIACASDDAPALWQALMRAGQSHGIKPCGLGARDTLRLEARLCLYGNDIDDSTTPLEAGLGWTVKFKGADFIGKEALRAQKKAGLKRKLVCLRMVTRGIARHGYAVHRLGDDGTLGEAIGEITSGTKSPTLGEAIALGYLPTEFTALGTKVAINVRDKPVQAEVIKGPFYSKS